MADRIEVFQTNFSAGELSPLIRAQVDFERHASGAETLKNWIVRPQGPISRRPGSLFAAEAKDSSKPVRLVPFIFTIGDAYVLEFGNAYIRFYQNNGQVTSGGSPFEVASPWADTDLDELDFAQVGDALYIVHPDFQPRKLVRSAATTWALSAVDFTDGPYLDLNATSTTLSPSATTGAGISITASATTGINGGSGFLSTDVGRLVRILNGATPEWGYAEITGITDGTTVTADVKNDFGGTGAVADWRLGAWSDTTGWPHAITVYQQRLACGGSDEEPQTIWAGVAGDLESFKPSDDDGTVQSDQAVTFTLAANRATRVVWLRPQRRLIVGTITGPWQVSGDNDALALTPTSIEARPIAVAGCDDLADPQVIGAETLYVQTGRRKVRAVGYDFESDDFRSQDATILAEHITYGGIEDLEHADQPDGIMWGRRNDGVLIGMTLNRAQNIFAWHRHVLGGVFGTGDAVVESITVIPTSEYDQLWCAVKRTINGATKRYVEFLDTAHEQGDDRKLAHYVDSGAVYSGSATTSISGLDHLEGETVGILADGFAHPRKTVSSGSITLDYEASEVRVGLPQQSDLLSFPVAVGQRINSLQGKVKKIHHLLLQLHEAGELDVGPDSASLDRLIFRAGGQDPSKPVPLQNDDFEVAWAGGFGRDVRAFIRASGPQPATILGMNIEMAVSDR